MNTRTRRQARAQLPIPLRVVAKRLGLSPRRIQELVRNGHLPAHRIPGTRATLFYADEIREALEVVESLGR